MFPRFLSQSIRNSGLCLRSNSTVTQQIPQKATEITEIEDNITKKNNPLDHPDYFQVHNLFTVKDLFDAKVHYGHKEGSLNEFMAHYLYGSRQGHLIFDLDITADYLPAILRGKEERMKFLQESE
ncbi:unnamed protein product, partial [Iphiclides podalirius]